MMITEADRCLLVQIRTTLDLLVKDAGKSREDHEVDKALETGEGDVVALSKRALQVRVMDAEEELCDAREALDEHLAFLKRIHSPVVSPDKE